MSAASVSVYRGRHLAAAGVRDRIEADYGTVDVGEDRLVTADSWSVAVIAYYDGRKQAPGVDVYQGFGRPSWDLPLDVGDLANHPDATGMVAALLAEYGLAAAALLSSLGVHGPLRLSVAVPTARAALKRPA